MGNRKGRRRDFRRSRRTAVLLALVGVVCQLLLPLLATAALAGSGPETVTICTASGVRAVPVDGGLPADGDQRGHVAGSLDCLLCCARLVTAVVPAGPARVPALYGRTDHRYLLAELLIGQYRIASKGPRAPPLV